MFALRKSALAALLFLATFGTASAHHQGDFFPIPRSLFTLELRMERTGEWRWRYEERCNNGNILPDVAGAFDDTSKHYGVYFVADPTVNPDLVQANISTCSTDFTGGCGAQAVACVGSTGKGYPLNCDAKYDGPYMATFWSFASRKSVPKHEWKHCSTRRAEDYDDSTATLRCIPSDSIMGCGPNHPLDYSARDDAAWATEHYPPALTSAYIDLTYQTIFFGTTNDRATRVAIIACRPDGSGCHFTGIYANPLDRAAYLPAERGVCFFAKSENELSWRYALTEVKAGCL